jgi:type 2 lantibiotic biosynthesis protein LanM
VTSDRIGTEDVAARSARWRNGVPFQADASNGTAIPGAVLTGAELWRLRLATAGLDEARLLALLADSDPGPGFAEAIDELCRARINSIDPDRPFVVATGALTDRVRAELGARLTTLSVAANADAARLIREPDTLVAGLVRGGLCTTLDTMLHRTMVSELARERAAGILTGSTATERFACFIQRFTEPDRRRALYDEYPVLARRLVTAARLWHEYAAELLERLVADLPELLDRLAAPPDSGAVIAVRTGLGDAHRGARSVALIEFASGWKAVYKPRPFGIDAHFQDLVTWINQRVKGLGLRKVRCFDRTTYGWMEFVESQPCSSERELRTFYRRQGALLALLYVLHANDISAENLVAVGDQPVLVDLETLLQPRIAAMRRADESPAEAAAADLVSSSVIHAGLLPSGKSGWAELSGMSIQDGSARSAIRIAHVEAGGTDLMRIRLQKATVARRHNQPNSSAGSVRLRDYTDHVVAGFSEVYEALRRHRAELAAPDGPLTALRADEVRVLLRDTSTYGLILGMSFHPRLLRNRWDQEQHLDLLWREVAIKPGLAPVTEGERFALWRGDIPVFTARCDDAAIVDDRGITVLANGVTSGGQMVDEQLDRLDDDDLARQVWLVRACMLTNGVRWDQPLVLARDVHVPATAPVATDALLSVAQAAAERLAELVIEDAHGAVWLGVHTGAGSNWQVGVVGPDLYAGGLGIALFLAYYAEVSGEAVHRDRARRAVAAALRQIERGRLRHGGGELGLLGLGGAVSALSELGMLWSEPGLVSTAHTLAAAMTPLIDRDEEFAVMDGAAGALLGLAALARTGRGATISDIARRAADHLLDAQGAATGTAAWLPRQMREAGLVSKPLAGYGHGASGIASALVCASELLSDTKYFDAALRAVDYERELFDPERNNWRDIRELAGPGGLVVEKHGDWTTTEGNSIAWCHGAVGIGLARLHMLRYDDNVLLRADLDAALDTTLRAGFGNGHSLCHGDFGSLELAVAVATERGDDQLWHRLRRHAATVVEDISRGGWRCGLYRDLEVPGLYTGVAGIGFGALRVAAAPAGPLPLTGGPHLPATDAPGS